MKVSSKALQFSAPLEFKAGDKPAAGEPRPFGGVGYSGGVVTDHWYWEDGVIFDLASTRSAKDEVPILWAHDTNVVVGRATLSIGSNVTVDGVIYDDADGQKVLGKPGHPWQMSVRIRPGRIYSIPRGESLVVNGLTVVGPCAVFFDSVIEEVSICTFGADRNTSAALFGGSAPDEIEIAETHPEHSMKKEEIEALVAQVAQLTADNAALNTEVTAFKQADIDRAAAVRADQIKEIFGADVSPEKAAPYMSMDETMFATVSAAFAELRTAKTAAAPAAPAQQQLPTSLFTSVVTAPAAPAAGSKSPLVADAERRAAARK